MKRFVGILGVLMILGVGVAGSALANAVAVYNASGWLVGNYAGIQAGIDACPVGGKVSVSAGTYMEEVALLAEVAPLAAVYVNKSIALVGVRMPVIDASGLGTNTSTSTVTFEGLTVADASISGFKITGAKGGNGINCKISANPRISDYTRRIIKDD